MSLSAESSFSGLVTDVVDSSSNLASATSTPPTTIADSSSLHSESPKRDVAVLTDETPAVEPALAVRPRRARVSAPVYNLAQLSGTAGHGKRASKGDIIINRRRTISGATFANNTDASPRGQGASAKKTVRDGIDALDLQRSLRSLTSPRTRSHKPESPRSQRQSLRSAGTPVSALSTKLSAFSKRSRKAVDKGMSNMTRELRRLQDTKEFAHVDDRPVVHTVWSNGKYVDPSGPQPSRRAKDETPRDESEQAEAEPITNRRKQRSKKYLDKGLYAGQETPLDPTKGLSVAEKKKFAQLPELIPSGRVNKTMPLPIFNGLRTLIAGRDFKLPYHICNPLPPGQPKPDEWKKMTKNRFIGESKDYWRKSPHFHDYQSKCVCKPEDGCGESCQNRIMLYECDEQNCNVGKQFCSNRAFANLTARRNKGGKFRVGVEVIKTSDRGYGVRSNRCFKPNQIIMEYAGEIITEEECERRMTEVYRDNECYYLMSFDQNMIIDATTGSIARFVNHSCNPNCRMIKWIVSGQPRMALFAGDRPIMTGDELTYDYNFDPFSAKNVQKCLCGEPNCRGVLGPKPREVKPPKNDLKNAVKATVKAGKRKLKELVGDDDGASGKAKKRKIQPATGVKRSISKASTKVAKGAATAIRKAITTKTKKTALVVKSPVNRRASTGAILKKSSSGRVIQTTMRYKGVVQTYGKSPRQRMSSAASSLTLVSVEKGPTGKAHKTKPLTREDSILMRKKGSSLTRARESTGKLATPRKAVEISRPADVRAVDID
ncbi:Fc.00g035940.m01.CDS01 [Cosmosporella sp. VM-42]